MPWLKPEQLDEKKEVPTNCCLCGVVITNDDIEIDSPCRFICDVCCAEYPCCFGCPAFEGEY